MPQWVNTIVSLLNMGVIFGFLAYRNRLHFKIEWELLRVGRPDLIVKLRQQKLGPWSTLLLGMAAFVSALVVHVFLHSGNTANLGGPLVIAGIFLVFASVGQLIDQRRR
ncbi:MAG: hypothetical protein C7B47_15510 [Sulfobacillus thermosulfidooxidans]|uniref:Uncharacterized protein n=1 Tax=Sulfobacillus thermosulfidooxidans TaxID=28034 RepID=A0A2T2WP37_SULTH|nr:MAG: hypothetical protein C7B47_15510 [Sulfobacillus thermosulfidooxidans]